MRVESGFASALSMKSGTHRGKNVPLLLIRAHYLNHLLSLDAILPCWQPLACKLSQSTLGARKQKRLNRVLCYQRLPGQLRFFLFLTHMLQLSFLLKIGFFSVRNSVLLVFCRRKVESAAVCPASDRVRRNAAIGTPPPAYVSNSLKEPSVRCHSEGGH